MRYQRIRDLREDADLTQEALVKKLSINRKTYYHYESGTRDIPFGVAIKLARIYKVSLDYIAGLTNEKNL